MRFCFKSKNGREVEDSLDDPNCSKNFLFRKLSNSTPTIKALDNPPTSTKRIYSSRSPKTWDKKRVSQRVSSLSPRNTRINNISPCSKYKWSRKNKHTKTFDFSNNPSSPNIERSSSSLRSSPMNRFKPKASPTRSSKGASMKRPSMQAHRRIASEPPQRYNPALLGVSKGSQNISQTIGRNADKWFRNGKKETIRPSSSIRNSSQSAKDLRVDANVMSIFTTSSSLSKTMPLIRGMSSTSKAERTSSTNSVAQGCNMPFLPHKRDSKLSLTLRRSTTEEMKSFSFPNLSAATLEDLGDEFSQQRKIQEENLRKSERKLNEDLVGINKDVGKVRKTIEISTNLQQIATRALWGGSLKSFRSDLLEVVNMCRNARIKRRFIECIDSFFPKARSLVDGSDMELIIKFMNRYNRVHLVHQMELHKLKHKRIATWVNLARTVNTRIALEQDTYNIISSRRLANVSKDDSDIPPRRSESSQRMPIFGGIQKSKWQLANPSSRGDSSKREPSRWDSTKRDATKKNKGNSLKIQAKRGSSKLPSVLLQSATVAGSRNGANNRPASSPKPTLQEPDSDGETVNKNYVSFLVHNDSNEDNDTKPKVPLSLFG